VFYGQSFFRGYLLMTSYLILDIRQTCAFEQNEKWICHKVNLFCFGVIEYGHSGIGNHIHPLNSILRSPRYGKENFVKILNRLKFEFMIFDYNNNLR
jgi:hypothetical protein